MVTFACCACAWPTNDEERMNDETKKVIREDCKRSAVVFIFTSMYIFGEDKRKDDLSDVVRVKQVTKLEVRISGSIYT